jgi:hexosaminidase
MRARNVRPRRLGLIYSLVAMMAVVTGAAGSAWGQAATAGIGTQQEAANVSTVPQVIPAPVSMQTIPGAVFTMTPDTRIVVRPGSDAAAQVGMDLATILRPSTGYPLPVISQGGEAVPHSIVLQLSDAVGKAVGEEGYRLDVTSGLVLVRAATPAGLFHGVETLRQLLPPRVESDTVRPGPWAVPGVHIVDYPRFPYRGTLLDVARHFFTVQEVEHYIDLLSLYKINVLHLHLTDDQGWRIAINSWPQLTAIGGSTEVGGGPGGYYTQQDYRDIVQYAADHFMTVVPEIDGPGHINAALASYPDLNCDGVAPPLYTGTTVGFSSLCVSKPITFQFYTDVMRELAALTPGSYIHMGGDEAKSTTPDDYLTFVNQAQKIVTDQGKYVMGWEEIAVGDLPPHSVIQHWHTSSAANALALEGVRKGAKVVMSPSPLTYLNRNASVRQSYQWDPATFVPGVTETDILGVEADMWTLSATVDGFPKTTVDNFSDVEFLTFPRMVGIAEIGWSPAQGRSWDEYRQRLAAQAPRWDIMGVNYYRSPDVPWPTE